MQSWFGEFQVNPNSRSDELKGMFNNPRSPVVIDCSFKLRDAEKNFISDNAPSLLEDTIWQTLLPEAYQWGGYRMAMFAAQFRERQPEVTAQVAAQLPDLLRDLRRDTVASRVAMQPGGKLQLRTSRLLSVIFSNYRPQDLGVIDYHGA
jgi:hypothetical protein